MDVVFRAHPAETRTPPDMRSRTRVVEEIRRHFVSLPDNIKLVDSSSRVSSYVLAEMAHVEMLYAGTLGLELALRGKRPWIAGDVTYRGKGFSLDLLSKEHMTRMLDARPWDDRLTDRETRLAQRFAYLYIFRYVFRNPFVDPDGRGLSLERFSDLAPGAHPVIEDLCEALLSGAPFLDIGRDSHAADVRNGVVSSRWNQ
jgi:hypothetical protein